MADSPTRVQEEAPEETLTTATEKLECLLRKYADTDVARGFGCKEPDFRMGPAAYTFPEDAFLADQQWPQTAMAMQRMGIGNASTCRVLF